MGEAVGVLTVKLRVRLDAVPPAGVTTKVQESEPAAMPVKAEELGVSVSVAGVPLTALLEDGERATQPQLLPLSAAVKPTVEVEVVLTVTVCAPGTVPPDV